MCFIVHPNYFKPKIAEQDIECYKLGSLKDGKFVSKFLNYVYEFGKIQPKIELKISPCTSTSEYKITYGYHSLMAIPPYSRYIVQLNYCYVNCIIPKGAVYFVNPDVQEYVSSQIIIQEIITL